MKDYTYFDNRLKDFTESIVCEVLETPEEMRTPRLGLTLMCWYVGQADNLWEEYPLHETPSDEMCVLFQTSQSDLYSWMESKGLTGKKP